MLVSVPITVFESKLGIEKFVLKERYLGIGVGKPFIFLYFLEISHSFNSP